MTCLDSEKYAVEHALADFSNEDLFTSSLKLFEALEYPIYQIATGKNLDIKTYIYSYIDKSIMFGLNEHGFLDKIQTISLLFALDDKLQAQQTSLRDWTSNQILFMTIDLKSSVRDRSYDAHTITKIINKIYKHPVFILFHHENHILFSGLVYGASNEEYRDDVYLSEWFYYKDMDYKVVDNVSQLSYGHHIQTTMYDFYYDLLFSISREYYVYPLSDEYFTYGCLSHELSSMLLENHIFMEISSYKIIKEYAIENSNYYRNMYGDDYVDNSESIELLLTNEDELLLMELDEDLFLDFDIGNAGDSSSGDEVGLDFEEEDEENDLIDEAEEDLFDDPVKLLEWLESNN